MSSKESMKMTVVKQCRLIGLLLAALQLLTTGTFAQTSLSDVRFKSIHNAYQQDIRPSSLLDDYNVWELELDFGVLPDDDRLIVGHDHPDPKFDLYYLDEWIRDAVESQYIDYHPLILKLEAKTRSTCRWFNPTCHWDWAPVESWGNWQDRLSTTLDSVLGERWLTRKELENVYDGNWPPLDELNGRVIVELIDGREGDDIDNLHSEQFFIPYTHPIPDIVFASPKATGPTSFGRAIRSGGQRILMDGAYKNPWSDVAVYPPQPTWVMTGSPDCQTGTRVQPYTSLGQAVNAYRTLGTDPMLSGEIRLANGTHKEKIRMNLPIRITANEGTISMDGLDVAYTIIIMVMDTKNAGTNDPIHVSLTGASGQKTAETPVAGPCQWLDRAAIQPCRLMARELGDLAAVTLRVDGDDDLYVEKIYVHSATHGTFYSSQSAWVGNDNVNPREFVLSR